MNAIVVVLYIALAIVALSMIPGIFVIIREIVRRSRAKRALEKLGLARQLIARLRSEPAQSLARALERQFDRRTVEAALEEALSEEAAYTDVCEKLGLRDEWERTLRRSRAWNERAHAARMLGKLRSSASSKTLLDALVDPHEDATVRLAAGQAIGAIKDEAVVPHLCVALASYDDRTAPCIAEALVSCGELAVPKVLELLDHARPTARTWAARVLGRIGHSMATLPLISSLGDADPATRAAVAEALGRIGDLRGARVLCTAALTDPVAPVRACAALAVAKTGDKESVRSIVFALRDPDAEVRSRAAEAIAALAPNDWSVLERALFDSCERVRRSAALSLDRLGAVALWTRALVSPLSEARVTARTALLAISRAGLSGAISAAATNEPRHIRDAVETLLADVRVEADNSSSLILSGGRSARIASRIQVLRELAGAGTPEATAALAEAVVSDPAPEARALAATSLSNCKERWLSMPALARALMDPVPEVALEASRVLAESCGGDRRERRISDIPPESKGSSRRTTVRLQEQPTLPG